MKKEVTDEVLNLSDALVLRLNLDGTIYFVNEKVLKTLEHTREELLGKKWMDIFIPSGFESACFKALSQVKDEDSDEHKNMALIIPAKFNRKKLIRWNILFIDKNETASGEGKIICVGVNITELTNLLKRYEKITKLNDMSEKFSHYLLRGENEERLLQKFCDILYEYEFAKYIWVGKTIDSGNKKNLIPVVARGFDIKILDGNDFSWIENVDLIKSRKRNIRRKKEFIYRNISDSKIDFMRKVALKFNIESVIVLPVFIDREVFGVIHLYSENTDHFDDDKIKCIEKMIIDFELAIEKIRLYKNNKKSLESIKKSEQNYKSLISQMNQGFALHKVVLNDNNEVIDYIFLDVNEKFEEYTGLKKEEVVGKSVLEIFPGTEKYWLEEYGKVAMTGNPAQFESFSGELGKYFLVSAYSPKYKEFAVTFTDVTDRYNAEKRFRDYIEKAPIGVILSDINGKCLESNRAFSDIIGYPLEKLKGTKLRNLRLEMDKENKKVFSTLIDEGNIAGVFRFRNMNGNEKYVNIKALKIDEDKLLGFVIDITKEMENERNLINLKMATERSIDGIGVYSNEYKLVYLNKAHANIYGYETVEELLGKSWRTLYREEEIRDFNKRIIPEFNRKGFWKGESLGKRKNGSLFPQEISISKLKDGGLICIVRDITEKAKIIEEREEIFIKTKKNFELFINTLVKMVELRDPYTSGHQERVAQLSVAIAKKMNFSREKVEAIRVASLLHDIGKIYIPSEILNKATKLTDLEFKMIKEHSKNGYDLLKGLQFDLPIAEYILQHHERNDGSGYPYGCVKNEIYKEARIIALADVVEAISSHRPYRPALGIEEAFDEIKKNSGILYDEEIVKVCLELFEEGFEFI